jgi:hypothetical protein
MSHISSYGSIYALGHKAILDLFEGPVVVEEKVDGSQFSFGVINGVLSCRSKGAALNLEAPEKMFNKAVETVKSIAHLLAPDYTYRGEYLQSPSHNTLKYNRVPVNHIILFDISTPGENYLSPNEKAELAAAIGLEVVPSFEVNVHSLEELKALCQRESVLGGVAMEGVVIKNYNKFHPDKKIMMGKYVREEFKEAHQSAWKVSNPTRTDVVQGLIDALKTEARWNKGVQHLRDAGKLEGSPKDIGLLMKEIPEDVLKECKDQIMETLFDYFWPQIRRGIVSGVPEWYKDQLAASSFNQE